MFPGDSVTVTAHPGGAASGFGAGAAGTGSTNSIHYNGGAGGSGATGLSKTGGGGGSSAGTGAAGNPGGTGTGGTAPAGGGNGGAGGAPAGAGSNGSVPGGGGGGGGDSGSQAGGSGAGGQITLTYTLPTGSCTGVASGTGIFKGSKVVSGSFKGVASLTATIPFLPRVVNQWAGTFAQPGTFASMPPVLQSTVIALTPATSVGGGSGVPTQGNWLFCVAGWNQAGIPPATVADSDDTHSFWRPGDVTKSLWAVSPASGNTRTSVWYTANLARSPGDVYCAPDGMMAGRAVTVIEVAGLGPWDTVTGIYASYAAAVTSLNLALPAPSSQAFLLAAVTGDSTAAGQSFTPAGWTPFQTVSAFNGADHSCDAVLTGAWINTTGSASVNATASSATDLSGVVIGVLQNAPSPVDARLNQNAPRLIYEMAFGAGFQTPPDQVAWTTVSDSAWALNNAMNAGQRVWGWRDSGGVQYQLGGLQSGTGTQMLANFDGAFSPARVGASGPWQFALTHTPPAANQFTVTSAQSLSISQGQAFTAASNPGVFYVVQSVGAPSGGLVNVTFSPAATVTMSSGDAVTQCNPVSGTPVRIRAALGTLGGVVFNRWVIIQRNAKEFPEQRDSELLLGVVPAGLTDIWSVSSADCPTPYRGEVEADDPGWWWPCDDANQAGGVKPAQLLNAADGSTTPLSIIQSPNGVYSAYGGTVDLGAVNTSVSVPANALYTVQDSAGWMYGDPSSSPGSAPTGAPVTAQPGAAAWNQAGAQCGNPGRVGYNGGGYGWLLRAQDTYPPIANGVTVEGWFKVPYWTANFSLASEPITQPPTPNTLWEMATSAGPVAVLYVDTSGHLQLTTYSGSSPTTTAIWTSSDLRIQAWLYVAVTMTQTSVTVYVNGGIGGSGSAAVTASVPSMTSAWSYFLAAADLGSGGGGATGGFEHACNLSVSHLAIYPRVLPKWRIWAHYCAAQTGFGVVPVPASFAVSKNAGKPAPDGSYYTGSAKFPNPGAFAGTATAVLGSATSGPAPEASVTFLGGDDTNIWASWATTCPQTQLYTSQPAGAEQAAALVSIENGAIIIDTYGSGASPPTGPTPFGDSVGERLERLFGYGGMTYPGRSVDQSPPLVQAALDVGGQAMGSSVQSVVDSDSGILSIDNNNSICYRARAHLASDTPVWTFGPNPALGHLTFDPAQAFSNDNQRVFTDIKITAYTPDGSTLPILTPGNAAGVAAAQDQYGPRPKPVTSYLQDRGLQQNLADWLFAQFGQSRRRVTSLKIDAAAQPAAWAYVLSAHPADLITVIDTPFGAPGTTGNYRISSWQRQISGGADGQAQATLDVVADWEPNAYW